MLARSPGTARKLRGVVAAAPTISLFAGAAAAAGAAALLVRRSRTRHKASQQRRLRTTVGAEASQIFAGDLPASVGGLSAGATGELAAAETPPATGDNCGG
jgi:hypothetical protein